MSATHTHVDRSPQQHVLPLDKQAASCTQLPLSHSHTHPPSLVRPRFLPVLQTAVAVAVLPQQLNVYLWLE